MTIRVYLAPATVRFDDGTPGPSDLPVERLFINASEVPEIWVETESAGAPDPGRSGTFCLARSLTIGITRVSGTVERKTPKQGS
jgi:hypothetical protein